MIETVTLHVPSAVYDRLKRRADQLQRTVEAELLEAAAAVAADTELPTDLATAVAQLTMLDDEMLWGAARSSLPAETAEQLERLNIKRQREGLTEGETQLAADLLHQYEQAMLIRAQAAALLKQRGHDLSGLLAPA